MYGTRFRPGRRSRAIADLPQPERLSRLHRPAVKAAILAEADRYREVHGGQPRDASVAPWLGASPWSTPPTMSSPPRRRSAPAPSGWASCSMWELAYDELLRDGAFLLLPLYSFRRRPASRVRTAPGSRCHHRSQRRWGPRHDDLRRLDPDIPAHPLGTRPHPRPPHRPQRGGSPADLPTGRPLRAHRPRPRAIRSPRRPQRDRRRQPPLGMPRAVRDLPAGGTRLLQDAVGYDATIVAGQVTRRHGSDTGARPGRLLRA